MPRGTPFSVPASVVWFSSLSGWTKLRITRLTDGAGRGGAAVRSISQWFFESNSATVRAVAQVHASSLQCQAPKIWIGVGVGDRPPPPPPPGLAATVTESTTSAAATASTRERTRRLPDIAIPPSGFVSWPLHGPGAPVGRRYGRGRVVSRRGASDRDETAVPAAPPDHPACFAVPERDTAREWIGSNGGAVRTVC